MLGRLFSSAAGSGRSPSSPESATEEQYTRNLLFSDTSLSSSPPWQTPTAGMRLGNFDDHNGFVFEEKDIRILLAQEDQERPSILFDTNSLKGRCDTAKAPESQRAGPSMRHERTTSSATPSKPYFVLQPETITPSLRSPTGAFQTRSRGSTVTGSQHGQLPSSLRDAETKDVDLLECMFGSSSGATSGTRLHVLRSNNKLPRVPSSPLVSPAALNNRTGRKPVLVRAQTSGQPSTITGHAACDMVLITRVFTVAPPELEKELAGNALKSTTTLVEENSDPPGRPKPPKLREKKTPAYAVSLVIQLPQQNSSRPISRHGVQGEAQYHSPPASSSFGSDLHLSWTFLDALPPSLSSSRSNQQSTMDGNVDFVLRRWDVVVRHLSIIEKIAKEKIFVLLSQVDETSSGRKTPKEKRMQRINQKIIRLPAFALIDDQELQRKSLQAMYSIRTALSTPSVRPLPGGHWLEEARLVARSCSQKGNDRFLAVLLTAFLGNHFEWINEIGRELHEKRLLLKWKAQQDRSDVKSRTVIICEDRILARRIVFLLSSFLFPGMLSLRSISSPDIHRSISRSQHDQVSSGSGHLHSDELSTSASPVEDDRNDRYIPGTTRRRLQRNLSETSSLRTAHLSIPHQDSGLHKSSAGTTTTVTPNPSTPLAAAISVQQNLDSYFPTAPGAAGPGSAAAASLQRLRRSSSTASSIPSTWGSLLGSIWSNKQTSSTGASSGTILSEGLPSTSTNSQISNQQPPLNQLESMAKEVGIADSPFETRYEDLLLASQEPKADIPPRLEVDEKDGVVDVDLNLPNSLHHSYASNPDVLPTFPTPMSTSAASLDDARSFFSVKSSPRTSTDHINNIAGFLKQYHPDFVLQGVRSCSEKEIRESMIAESNVGTADESPRSSYGECSTLIADTRNYSVKRLTLRRKARTTTKEASTEQIASSQDEFSLESILSYDETLADGIDRALDKPSAMSSRLPSPSPSKSRHSRTVSMSTTSTMNAPSPLATSSTPAPTKGTLQAVPVPQRNRGQFIIDALKEVVGEVDRDLHKHSSQRAENIPMGSTNIPSSLKPLKTEENILREGVKRWLQGAEETSVW